MRYDNLFDLHFVAAEEPCVLAATMGTDLAVRDGRVVFSAAVAMGDSGNGFDLQFAAPEHVFFIRRPSPAVGEVFRHDSGYLADIHHYRRDVLYAVLLRCFFYVADDIEYDT